MRARRRDDGEREDRGSTGASAWMCAMDGLRRRSRRTSAPSVVCAPQITAVSESGGGALTDEGAGVAVESVARRGEGMVWWRGKGRAWGRGRGEGKKGVWGVARLLFRGCDKSCRVKRTSTCNR